MKESWAIQEEDSIRCGAFVLRGNTKSMEIEAILLQNPLHVFGGPCLNIKVEFQVIGSFVHHDVDINKSVSVRTLVMV
jgi:hypothetical protein